MNPAHKNYFFQACVFLSLVFQGGPAFGLEEEASQQGVETELSLTEDSLESVLTDRPIVAKRPRKWGLGLGGGWRMERAQLVEGESAGAADSLLQIQVHYQLKQWRLFLEQSYYSRRTSSGSLTVEQKTQLSQMGYRYRLLSQGRWSPYLGLALGFGRDRVKTGLDGEFMEVQGQLFGLGTGELGLEGFLGERLMLEGGGRLTYPQKQDVSGQIHLKLSYLF